MILQKEIMSMEWMPGLRGKTFRKIGSALNVVPPKKIFLKLTKSDQHLQEVGVH